MKIPKTHQTVMPYLILNEAQRFIEFVQVVFDANVSVAERTNDGSIVHAEVYINECTIMFAEATESWGRAVSNLFIYVDDADTTFNKAVSHGGKVIMELSDKDYGRAAGVEDPSGNVWWITAVS